MVIGVLATSSQAETCLNNLSEQDFDLPRVSVVMKDVQVRNAIAKDTGPLMGTTSQTLLNRLHTLGLAKKEAQAYVDAVNSGQVLIAIDCKPEAESAALQTLDDYSPKLARVIHRKK